MNLTPKEKAKELINKFFYAKKYSNSTNAMSIELAKECALICVHEIIKIAPSDKSIFGTQYLTIKEYYEQVKREIENL
jgi:hypothetical protein